MAAQLDARLVMARIAAMKQLRSMLPSDAAVRGVVAAIAEPFYAAEFRTDSSSALLKALTAAVADVEADATQPSSRLKARLVALTPPQPCVSVNAGADAVARRRSQTPPAAPFAVDALIVAHAGPYAGHPLAFRLVFNAPYLSSPPKIRCRTYALSWLFTGVALSDRGDPVAMRRCGVEFYKFLLKKSSSPFELGTVLTALADALEPGAHPFFAMSAAVHAGRLGVIDKFASLGLAKLLPSTAQTAFRADGLRAALESGALPRGALPPALVAALLEAEQLRAAGSDDDAASRLRELCEPLDAELFAVDLFEESFAAALLADVDAFEATGLPVSRPNSMNKYGVVVNDVGFEHLITTLQRFVLQPLASALYGGRAGGDPAADFDAHQVLDGIQVRILHQNFPVDALEHVVALHRQQQPRRERRVADASARRLGQEPAAAFLVDFVSAGRIPRRDGLLRHAGDRRPLAQALLALPQVRGPGIRRHNRRGLLFEVGRRLARRGAALYRD